MQKKNTFFYFLESQLKNHREKFVYKTFRCTCSSTLRGPRGVVMVKKSALKRLRTGSGSIGKVDLDIWKEM